MANHFLGFNGWISSVEELTEIDFMQEGDDVVFVENNNTSSSSLPLTSKSQAPPIQETKSQSHWFAIVQIKIPKYHIISTGRGYGLSGGGTMVQGGYVNMSKIGQAKKAAINLARSNALSRLCLVLLDGVIKYVHLLPMDQYIETSIIWDNSNLLNNPRPDPALLPCTCVEDEGEDGGNKVGLLNKFQHILDDLDNLDGKREIKENVKLCKVMKKAGLSYSK